MLEPSLQLSCSIAVEVQTMGNEAASSPWVAAYDIYEHVCEYTFRCDMWRSAPEEPVYVGECFDLELAVSLPGWEEATAPIGKPDTTTASPSLYYRLSVHPRRWLAVGQVQGPLLLMPGRPGIHRATLQLAGSRCGLLRLPSVAIYERQVDGRERELPLLNAARSEQILVQPSTRQPPPRISFF